MQYVHIHEMNMCASHAWLSTLRTVVVTIYSIYCSSWHQKRGDRSHFTLLVSGHHINAIHINMLCPQLLKAIINAEIDQLQSHTELHRWRKGWGYGAAAPPHFKGAP